MRSAIKSNSTMALQPLAREARACGRRGLNPALCRLAAALLLLLTLQAAANAYTLVMRSGRHLEIPESFTLTRTTLTYEAAPGVNVTLQLNTIDIAATERLNGEPPGSLLSRAREQKSQAVAPENSVVTAPPPSTTTAAVRPRRTITNRDLEGARLAREQSEAAYERRRLELGLPSLEETRRRSEEEAARLRERSRRSEEESAQAESYWRARASELRTELAVVDAQLNYLRSQLGQSRQTLLTGSYTVVAGLRSFFPFRSPHLPINPFPHSFGGLHAGAQVRGTVAFGGGSTRGRILINPALPVTSTFHRHPAFSGPRLFAPSLGLLAASFPIYDTSYDRTMMLARLRELEAVRAGLEARWRLLEEEARRGGAPPGWLRP